MKDSRSTTRRRACRQGVVTVLGLALATGWMPAEAGVNGERAGQAHTAPVAAKRAPRLVAGSEAGREALAARIARDPAAAAKLEAIRARLEPHVARHGGDPAWIVSRLQMYWQSKASTVHVKDSLYHHASGTAPVPTVRFTGGRDSKTAYATPRLEDVKPYMGENDLLYLQNKESGQWEWVHQAKTGRIVEAINMQIAALARDAAFLAWYTGDERYAAFAAAIFDTYMSGMAYRDLPLDLNRAHDGTIVGLQSYEVIHEDIVGPLAETYDFMHARLRAQGLEKAALYDAVFRKWADVILANGVPWNNWNLIKARFVLQIAAVLGEDGTYPDGRGAGHYVRAVVDGSGVRQWSLKRLLDYGYDQDNGIWNESPGYAVNVASDYIECLELLERVFGIDLLPRMPVLQRAVTVLPQYLLPNGRTVGFGDTRYDFLRTNPVDDMLAYARHRGDDTAHYRRLLAALEAAGGSRKPAPGAASMVHGLFAQVRGAVPDAPAAALTGADVRDYQTPVFHAPNVSWLIQRNGYTGPGARDRAMVISQAGSSGNHAHANGIAMELYAHGVNLVPESGRGSGYLQNDHLQYYAQFPAHNTVVVDGASTYPSMKADHPMLVDAVYPASRQPAATVFPWATFSDVSFTEPATNASQRRVLATVRLDDDNGYFIDIFRSRRANGKDKYHDYVFHGLGQSMALTGVTGTPLATNPSQRLSFADGDLFGYDFWSERRSLTSTAPLKARFDLKLPDRALTMHSWLQGSARREYFAVQGPPSTAWPVGMLPDGIDKLSSKVLVVRQAGEAWSHPFSAVIEAVRDAAPPQVLAVEEIMPGREAEHAYGLRVTAAGGRVQTVMSNDRADGIYDHGGKRLAGRYGIVAERDGQLDYLFLGHGTAIAGQDHALAAAGGAVSAALWRSDGKWRYSGSGPVQLRVPARGWPASLSLRTKEGVVRVAARALREAGRDYKVFVMPATGAAALE
ncbi:heparinase II/III domain-containing protein [Telluria beijingensis]|uniref:heparinase II/III domain-containing protein n=1 Tax=Telluria beijingensis TaxID=3068633 RepID=UPI0027960F42|nr:heparinase II/III family protein [Massilia sp. REN29]